MSEDVTTCEFEFVDELPPRDERRPKADMHGFTDALRARPGEWAKWPADLLSASVTGYASGIRKGMVATFRGGFDAAARNGVLYVRYLGEVGTDE